jgi:hypothetical protein
MLPLQVSGLVAVAVLKQAVLVRAGASWDMVHVGVAASGQRACSVYGKGGVARPVRPISDPGGRYSHAVWSG